MDASACIDRDVVVAAAAIMLRRLLLAAVLLAPAAAFAQTTLAAPAAGPFTHAVPEPPSLTLLACGLAALVFVAVRREDA